MNCPHNWKSTITLSTKQLPISRLVGWKAYGIIDAWSGEEFQVALEAAEAGHPDQLNGILAQEEQNYRSIDQCLADFRGFIRKELRFKEGF